MKLTNIGKILSIGAIALVMTGCGGGSGGGSTPDNGGSTQPPATDPQPPVASSPFDVVQELYDGEQLTSVGSYTGTGLNYYDLTIPSDGNLVIETSYDGRGSSQSVKLYDRNLNLIKDSFSDGEPFSIDAGDYILSFDYNDGGTITLNSNT